MIRARYPLLAFVTLAVVVVGYAFFTARGFGRRADYLTKLQALRLAEVVQQVAVANESFAMALRRELERLDNVVVDAVAAQVEAGDRLRSQKEILRSWMARLYADRALLVDEGGRVLVDEGRRGRPGKTEASPLERIETARVVEIARAVAAGAEPPAGDAATPFVLHLKPQVFRRVGDRFCLVLLRSDATIERLAPRTTLPPLLESFEGDPSIAYVGLLDADGNVVAEARGRPAAEVFAVERGLALTTGAYTLRVEVNLDEARSIQRRAATVPILVGVALFLAGGVAMALVFRLQHAYLEKERELRARAERDRRLAALGRLTAGVAHEIKNPLNAIRLSVGRLQRRVDEPAILDPITESVVSITKTVEDFMKLARDPTLSLEAAEPGEVLDEALAQVRPMADELGRELVRDGEKTPGTTRLDRARLREAIVSLLRNALQAAASRVVTRVRRSGDRFLVEVDDDGPGLPKEQRAEVLEYFFTTKPDGTGLGLPLAHRVAEEHGGSLEIGDAPLGGARFTLTLPCR